MAGDGYRLLLIGGHDVKWGSPRLGTGAVITYAIAENAVHRSGIVNCRRNAPIGGLLAHSRLTKAEFRQALDGALQLWESAADIRFLPAKNATTANLLITAQVKPDGIAYTDVKLAPTQRTTLSRVRSGVVCLNPGILWSAGATARSQTGARVAHNLKYVLAHEIGHALGLDHPSPEGELMSFAYNPAMKQLQPGDVAGITTLYGVPQTKAFVVLVGDTRSAP